MSYLRRQAKLHEIYEAPSGNEQALTKLDLSYEASYPGPRETRIVDAENWNHPTFMYDPNAHDYVNWATGGIAGHTKIVGSMGVTDPKTIDAHDFAGMMAVVRRMPDTNYGPVGQDTHNAMLSLIYAMQESSHYFPNEISQQDVIKSV